MLKQYVSTIFFSLYGDIIFKKYILICFPSLYSPDITPVIPAFEDVEPETLIIFSYIKLPLQGYSGLMVTCSKTKTNKKKVKSKQASPIPRTQEAVGLCGLPLSFIEMVVHR